MPQQSQHAALITGAGRRIGAAIARTLAGAGYAVVLHANRSRAEAEKLAGEIVARGGRASVVLAELTDRDAVGKLVKAAAAFGPLTLLVNSASEFNPDDIGSLERARFERTLAVNLTAPLFLSQAFAAQAPDGASIVNIVDQRVLKPTPLFFSYTLSKSALHTATIDAGAGAGAQGTGQCGGAGADAAEPAPERGAIRRAGGQPAAAEGARARRTSPPRCFIWRRRKALPVSPSRSTAASTWPGARPTAMSRNSASLII